MIEHRGSAMNFRRRILLLPLTASLALGQTSTQPKPVAPPDQPEALVRSLYTEVVARHPKDITIDENWKVFASYFSKALLHRFDLARACSVDWDRSNPDPYSRARAVPSYQLFSGEEGGKPGTFQIQKALPAQDGSSRVYVELRDNQKPPYRPYTWRVAAVVVRDNGRSVLDDVIYINDADYRGTGETKPPNRRLSEYLSAGCNGPHWIGYSLPNQPEALVRGLYEQVLAYKPLDVPSGISWKVFAPYFSKTLPHEFDVYSACMSDWDRQNQNSDVIVKPPGLIEFGIFSGGDEEADPRSFQVERAETETDGSVHVYVALKWWETADKNADRWHVTRDKPYVWRVADVLIRENGRLVLDDVIFLKDPKRLDDVDTPLSKLLTVGCDGPHWVGYREH
jgi:hypothetical protein